ncbi:MAG: SusC/RagA family TonB-linked outer membrane protein [Chitinophagaceae bacterium]
MKNTKIFITKAMSIGFLLLFSISQVFSQTKTVSGKVTDSKDGSPIVGATVQAKGAKTGTSTGADGSYSLTVGANVTTLVITSVGFDKQEINVNNASVVALVASNANLNEVVVIGYGTARKKDLTGAVASIQAKNFNKGTIASPDQLLQSKVAGVLVTVNSGEPGAGTTVQIRGTSSLRANNNPLYVIDGVPLDGRNAEPGNSNGDGPTPSSNPLLFINPSDVASIDVLKDASSAAIYGSRGANGVIAITLKKGVAGPTKVDVGMSFGKFAGYMKRFDVLDRSQFLNALTKYGGASSLNYGGNVDALKDITNSSISSSYNLALSGGNETGKYRASFYGTNQEGFVKGTGLQKYIGSFTGTERLLDKKLTLDFDLIAGNVPHTFGYVFNTTGSAGNLMSAALQWNPTQNYRGSNGQYIFPANGTPNPMALIDGIHDKASTTTILGNISGAYKILPNLEYKMLYAINHSEGNRLVNYEGWLQGLGTLSGNGLAAIANARLNSQTFTHTLNYNADLTQKLHLNALVGYEYWKSDYSADAQSANTFNFNLTQTARIPLMYTSVFQDAKNQNPHASYVDPTTELQSYFARAILNYDDKYVLTATVRRDGSSKFGVNNKYGTFPSFAALWRISNEGFMKDSRVFSNLALRASYGITGNQEFPSGSSLEQFSFPAYNTFGQVNVYNPNLKWEQTKSTNIGLDFGILKGRVYGSFDYYNKNTTNLLYQGPAIQPAPASSVWLNLPANLVNKGYEIAVGATLIQQKDFSLDLSVNWAHNNNKLSNFTQAGILSGAVSGQGVSGAFSEIITNNQPLLAYYLKPFLGFDQNGNQLVGDNPQFAGDPNPHNLFGGTISAHYKKFDLVINGGGASGYLIYNNTATSVTNIAGILNGRNIDKNAYNSVEKASSGVAASTRFLESGNFFKLRNASITYNAGSFGKFVKNASVFLTGNNLFVITKFSGFDPEVNIDKSNGGYPSKSIEYIPYPTARTITIGLNLSLF